MRKFRELVVKLDELYTIECCEHSIWIFELNVVLSYDESSKLVSIYREFLYFDYDDDQKYLTAVYQKLLFLQELCRVSKQCPTLIYNSQGDSYDAECIGFYGVELKEEDILEILSWVKKAEYGTDELDFELLQQNYADVLERYMRLENEIAPDLTFLRSEGWNEMSSYPRYLENEEYDGIYINSVGTIVCGFGYGKLKKICEAFGVEKYREVELYKGFTYCIGKDEDRNLYWDIDLLNEIDYIIECLEFEGQYDTQHYITNSSPQMLLVKCTGFWGIVLPINDNGIEKAVQERKKLKDQYERLAGYIPREYSEEIIDFSLISAEKFEYMCRDLLIELGFVDVYLRGGINAPDGGVDIVGIELDKRIFETRRIRWLFQCKHVKKQLDRKDLVEIPMLLEEFSAECYGVFYTGVFSAQTLDRIENINRSKHYCIKCWDGAYISRLIEEYPRIKEKYFGI